MRVNIKPLSVNECWKGRRFKTDKYIDYEFALSIQLPKIELPKPPYYIYFIFGLSNVNADVDNPVKPTLDILQKKYKFNDSKVYKITEEKIIVPKGEEFIDIKIEHYEINNSGSTRLL